MDERKVVDVCVCVCVYECVDVEDLVLEGESAVDDALHDGDLGSLHGLLDDGGSEALLLGSDLLGGDLGGDSSGRRGGHFSCECVCVVILFF